MVVFPVPISPVKSTKLSFFMPYNKCASASRWRSLMNRYRGSGAMENGSRRSLKKSVYMAEKMDCCKTSTNTLHQMRKSTHASPQATQRRRNARCKERHTEENTTSEVLKSWQSL